MLSGNRPFIVSRPKNASYSVVITFAYFVLCVSFVR